MAWLDATAGTLAILPQRYERRGTTTFGYELPTADNAGLLEVSPEGILRRHPERCELET